MLMIETDAGVLAMTQPVEPTLTPEEQAQVLDIQERLIARWPPATRRAPTPCGTRSTT